MFARHVGIIFGATGAVIVIILGGLLALQPQLSATIMIGTALLPLFVTIVAAIGTGRQARKKGQNITVEGAIVGFFMTLGVVASNIILATSPAYEKAMRNLFTSENGLQVTAFELSPGSVISSLLVNVLIATIVAYIAGHLFISNSHINPSPQLE